MVRSTLIVFAMAALVTPLCTYGDHVPSVDIVWSRSLGGDDGGSSPVKAKDTDETTRYFVPYVKKNRASKLPEREKNVPQLGSMPPYPDNQKKPSVSQNPDTFYYPDFHQPGLVPPFPDNHWKKPVGSQNPYTLYYPDFHQLRPMTPFPYNHWKKPIGYQNPYTLYYLNFHQLGYNVPSFANIDWKKPGGFQKPDYNQNLKKFRSNNIPSFTRTSQ